MINERVTGMPVNNCRKFDAMNHMVGPTSIIQNESYSGGSAVRAYYLPSGVTILKIDEFPEGELSGMYAVRVFWTGSNLGSVECRARLYQDGVEIPGSPTDMYYGPESMNVGTSIIYIFDPRYSYTFTLEVGDRGDSNITIDYVQFDQVYHGGAISDRIWCVEDTAGVYIEEYQLIEVTGNGTAAVDKTITFSNTFIVAPILVLTSYNQYLHPSIVSKTYGSAVVNYRHIDSSSWSVTVYMEVLIKGFVEPPYTPETATS